MLSKLIGQSGQVEFNTVTEEAPEYFNQITSHAVESGQDVADHVKLMPNVLPINGVVAGDDAAQKLQTLKQFRQNAELLQYIGRNAFSNVVIESLTTRHTARVRNGFEFDLTLRQVRIARAREVQIAVPAAPRATTQTNQVQNKGRQQPKQQEPFFTFQDRPKQTTGSIASLREAERRLG